MMKTNKNKSGQIRQGDVLLVPIDDIPAGLPKRTDRIIALGEQTGAKHTMTAGEVYGTLEGVQYVVVDAPDVEIEHLPNRIDHDNLPVPQRKYKYLWQVEETADAPARRNDD